MTKTGKTLHLKFHGRVIDHLGIQMYQSPVAALAELVANAWDADAQNVWINLPSETSPFIKVRDDGNGMTFEDCENHYLNVGWCKRESGNDHSPSGRLLLGRKGIGKFAGFGIAKKMVIETTSGSNGEHTAFTLDVKVLRGRDYIQQGGKIDVDVYTPPNDLQKQKKGTTIMLTDLDVRRPSGSQFAKSMARRFLLHQRSADFHLFIDDAPIPSTSELEGAEFVFPKSYTDDQRPTGLAIDSEGWGQEYLPNGNSFRWRIVFYEDPIDDEELRGVTVFARGKLAQAPFFFQLSGGLGGQHGQEYLSGQVQADFLDELDRDLIATDRQSVNWEDETSTQLREWGRTKVKELLRIWHDRRGSKRAGELEKKVEGFGARLDKLQLHEARTVRQALKKLAQVSTLSKAKFQELGEAVLTAWEQGRLRNLISNMADIDSFSETQLMSVLVEAQALTALNIAEAVKTKILTIGGLKLRIQKRELETAVRDFIAVNPWLIAPTWETFRVERSVINLLNEISAEAGLTAAEWKGRVDLALCSGTHLLILEFMRPGLKLDWDHLGRFERYVRKLRKAVSANTGGRFRTVTGYIIADEIDKDSAVIDKIEAMQKEDMLALDWRTLFSKALAQWEEFLEALADRAPGDERIKALLDLPNARRQLNG